MYKEVKYGVDKEGILISVQTGENCYTVFTIPPNVCDRITEQWYVIAKDEVVTIPPRKSRNRRFSGTISRS